MGALLDLMLIRGGVTDDDGSHAVAAVRDLLQNFQNSQNSLILKAACFAGCLAAR